MCAFLITNNSTRALDEIENLLRENAFILLSRNSYRKVYCDSHEVESRDFYGLIECGMLNFPRHNDTAVRCDRFTLYVYSETTTLTLSLLK